MAMEVNGLVKQNGNQLELQGDSVDHLMEQVSQVDYIAVLCALGEPASGKTSIMNAVIKNFLEKFMPAGSEANSIGFLQPKNSQNDRQRIDGILVTARPFQVLDNLGRHVAVIMLDVWNNFAESEEVYGKLVDFCFQVSSLTVFSLSEPFRPVPWWNGSFECSNDCSSELKQVYSHLKTTLKQEQDEGRNSNDRSSCVIAIKTCWKDEAEYFPVIIHGDEATVSLSDDCFNFILKQILSRRNHDRLCKPSELKNHLSKCVSSINNTAATTVSQTHQNVLSVAVHTDNAERSQQILQVYKKRLLQVYSESSQVFLSSQELDDYSNGLVNEFGNDREEVVGTCESHYEQLKEFHKGVESSIRILETEVDKRLGETLSCYEKTFASGFKRNLEDYKAFQHVQRIDSSVAVSVEKITFQVLTALHSSQCPLKDEIEILSSKLKANITQKLLQDLNTMQKQMEIIIQTFKVFKSELERRIQRSTCLLNDDFEEAAEHAWKAMEAREMGTPIRPSFIHARDEAVQEYEDKLRQQNDQIFKSELCLAKQATDVAADYVVKLLSEHLKKFGVLTDKEVKEAFGVASDNAKKAFLTAPGFNDSPPWQEALQSLQSTLEDRYSEVRQINLNAIRRWDRALESALRSSAEFYSQKMDQRLPKHKISLKELEKIHETCAEKTVSQFTVSSEVNAPTKAYWKKILMKNQLQEWKEGYVCVNETKQPVEEVKRAHFPEQAQKNSFCEVVPEAVAPKTSLPQSQSFDYAASNVGVYFGPEIIIFTASLPGGAAIQLPILPFAACSETEIFWGEEALQVAQSTGQLFNIFSVLTQPTVPLEQPCTLKLKGKSVCLTAETLSVLFFKHIVAQIIVQTGHGIRSCAVALPGLLPRGAMTAVKEAIRLAGFSIVTLVPFTTALAMSMSLQQESFGSSRISKKIVTIYHAGKFIEVALLVASPRKLEVKNLVGCLDLSTVKINDLPSYTRKLVEQVAEGDVFATVITIGREYKPIVKESLMKAIREIDSIKLFGFPIIFTGNASKRSISPANIAQTMAELDGNLTDSYAAKPERAFPKFSYFRSYEMKLPGEAILIKSSKNEPAYRYFLKHGHVAGFNMLERGRKNHWNYDFDLDPQSSGGYACTMIFLPDGTFRIEPPSNGPGIPVHSRSCKLLTFWGQESVKQNVERMMKLMGMKDTEKDSAVEVKNQEIARVQKTDSSVRFTLIQLVRQVEHGLKKSGLSQGPVYDFIYDSLQECRQCLQDPTSTEQNLNVAMRKLRIRSSDLLKK